MPEDSDSDFENIIEASKKILTDNGAIGEIQSKEELLAFGLKSILILAMYDIEGKDFEGIAEKIAELEDVHSAEVSKMDLAMG